MGMSFDGSQLRTAPFSSSIDSRCLECHIRWPSWSTGTYHAWGHYQQASNPIFQNRFCIGLDVNLGVFPQQKRIFGTHKTGFSDYTLYSSIALSANTWYYVRLDYEYAAGGAGRLRLYVDETDYQTVQYTQVMSSLMDVVSVGANPSSVGGPYNYWEGDVCECALWETAMRNYGMTKYSRADQREHVGSTNSNLAVYVRGCRANDVDCCAERTWSSSCGLSSVDPIHPPIGTAVRHHPLLLAPAAVGGRRMGIGGLYATGTRTLLAG